MLDTYIPNPIDILTHRYKFLKILLCINVMEQLKINSINHMIVCSIGKLSHDMIDMTNND